MNLPISSAVICEVTDLRGVIEASRRLKFPPSRVSFQETPDGLTVHGLTELDLEIAIEELRKIGPPIRQGKPQVAYDMGPPLLEPYYRVTVDVPELNVGTVIGDLSSRRATVLVAQAGPVGRQIVADIPVSECFGYSTVLRMLTQGRGAYAVEFGGYRPPLIPPGHGDAA